MLATRRYLSPDERARLDSHLEACGQCRAVEEEFGRQDAFLTTLRTASPPTSLRDAVLAGSPKPIRKSWWRSGRVVSLAGGLPATLLTAAAVVLIVAAASLHAHSGASRRGGESPPGQPTYDASAPLSTVVRDTPQGLRIALSAPATSPKHVLLRVTVRVTNTSANDIPLEQAGSEIGAAVFTDEATVTPALEGGFGPLGGGPGNAYRPPLPLHPGQTIERDLYGVAVAPYLRAHVEIQDADGHAVAVDGPTITLRLTQEQAPAVTLHTRPEAEMSVQSAASNPGPLYYSATTSCMEDSGNEHEMGALHDGWFTSPGPVLKAQWPTMPSFNGTCTHDFEWHVVAGYLGQPAVHLDYITPSLTSPSGSAVPSRETTCGADRGKLPELPASVRNAAGETDVVRAACGNLPGALAVRVASMSLQEFLDLDHSSSGTAAGDQWVWVVSVYPASANRSEPANAVVTKVFDGVTGKELPSYSCDRCDPLGG